MNILPFVQFFNAAGARLRNIGLPLVPFDSESFMAQASQKTGLHDFGQNSFLEPLHILLEACEQEADLSMVGRLAVKGESIRLLANRLQLVKDRKTYPELSHEPITSPLFIVGLPRTGSTLLQNLLALDPGNRAPRMWETMFPSPPPHHPESQVAQRIRRTDQLIKGFYLVAPKFKMVHPMTAQDPTECVTIMSHSFMSAQFQSTYRIPSYQKWLDSGNLRPAYLEHRQFLQQLQWSAQPRQWVLKAPAHIFSLESLLTIYPDAKIVQTHRAPQAVLGSVSSLDVILRQAFSRSVNPQDIGKEALTQWANAVQRAMNVRDALAHRQHQFYDVNYETLETEPIETIQKIYRHFGLTLTNTAKDHMMNYLRTHPKHQHGAHQYSLTQFGLTKEAVYSHFKPYILRYNLDA